MTSPPSGLRASTAEPHSPQKTLSRPLPGDHTRRCCSPAVTVNEPGSIRAEAAAPVPVRRWQRVQWQ